MHNAHETEFSTAYKNDEYYQRKEQNKKLTLAVPVRNIIDTRTINASDSLVPLILIFARMKMDRNYCTIIDADCDSDWITLDTFLN